MAVGTASIYLALAKCPKQCSKHFVSINSLLDKSPMEKTLDENAGAQIR